MSILSIVFRKKCPDITRREFMRNTLVGVFSLGMAAMLRKNAKATLPLLEVDISDMCPGESRTVRWNDQPVFIHRCTEAEIRFVNSADLKKMRDPQTEKERVKNPEWVVLIGLCTHLGCVPIANKDGWLCPCHSSQFDILGRVITGPARKNLKVPPYKLVDSKTLLIGAEE